VCGILLASISIVSTSFSTDGGRTWSLDPPVVAVASPRFLVKVEYSGSDTRPLDNGGYISNSISSTRDFASAIARGDSGYSQNNSSLGATAWRYLKNAPRPIVYKIDIGARPAGVKGRNGKPLPACAAWKPGVYRFDLRLSYGLDRNKNPDVPAEERQIATGESFMLTLK